MKEKATVLLIEDDTEYAKIVGTYFAQRHCQYELNLLKAETTTKAVELAGQQDLKVVIVDLALPDGQFGTDTIDAIWNTDKKVIFIIHSVLDVEKMHDWLSKRALPYTSRFYLQKTGFTQSAKDHDVVKLFDLVLHAIKCYVPYFEPTIISVKDSINAIEKFWSDNKSFNRLPVVENLHYSQDLMNKASRWACDRLSRSGYDTTKFCAVIVGSLARLEGSPASDVDYFLVFDDEGLPATDLEQLTKNTHRAFVQLGTWFRNSGIEIHDFDTPSRRPENIDWHTTTLPTWFPSSTLLGRRLGIDTQIELSKLWFLLEGCPVFNKNLFADIHGKICEDLKLFPSRNNRDNVIHSELNTSLNLLSQGFDRRTRRRKAGEDLIAIKHVFIRRLNILANKLFLLQCFLDPELYDLPGSYLIRGLPRNPLVKLIEFYNFVLGQSPFRANRKSTYKRLLRNISNCYVDGLQKLNNPSFRRALEGTVAQGVERDLINDLLSSSADCKSKAEELMEVLKNDPIVGEHNNLKRFWHE